MVYNIGELEFKSKKAAEDYTRNIINTIGKNDCINEDNKHFQFFVDLLNNHQRREYKIGCGIKSFIITINALGTGFETLIRRTDDSIESFSWKDCSSSTFKNNKDKLDIALRSAIQSQIQEFKLESEEICAECNKHDKCAVDHKSPTFYELKSTFLLSNPMREFTFRKDIKTHQEIFSEADKDFECLWQKYHKENAVLQYLCKKCHNEKTKNDIAKIKDFKECMVL